MGMETSREKVMVFCYLNGCVKYGPDGVYYEGSLTPKKLTVKRKTKLNRFLDEIYTIFGLDKETSKFEIFGRYPVAVSQHRFTYAHLPVVDDNSLETMLELPSNHPSINAVELYLEVNVYVDNNNEKISASKPQFLSTLWVDDHELRVGLCFRDSDELKKVVGWCSINGHQRCVLHETEKGEYVFECLRSKCNWSLCAARIEEHGVLEITKYTGPHTCSTVGAVEIDVEFAAEEIESLIRTQPTLTIVELQKWWFEKFGYEPETWEMQEAKLKVIKKIYRDWDESFRVLPKLMAALHSSNGVLVDWQYDCFPNPEFASFRGMFWAFPQSIEGFRHCRPLIIVDTKELEGEYPMKLMIASGLEANQLFFPLAFAVTKEVSSDTWRWFLAGIRDKVTQRKGLCLISSSHPDILAAINEPGSRWQEPWAYHMFCLDHLCSQFHDVFKDNDLKHLVKKAGWTRKKEEFNSHMETIRKENPEARKWLDAIPSHKWALAHDSGGRRYGQMSIDTRYLFSICESFQSLGLPVTVTALLLFDALRLFFHVGHLNSNREFKRGDMYMKYYMSMFQCYLPEYVVLPLDKGVFQVTCRFQKDEIVQLSDGTCTCGDYQTYKSPCTHALAVCRKLKINPLQYVDDCYTVERCYKTYSVKFNPVPEVSAWPEASGVPTLFPPVVASPPSSSSSSAASTSSYYSEEEVKV